MNPQSDEIVQTIRLKAVNDGAQQTIVGVRDQVKGLGADLTQLNAVGQRTVLPFDGLAAEVQQATIPFDEIAASVREAADSSERLKSNVKTAGSGEFSLGSVRGVVGQAGGLLSAAGAGQAGSAVSSVLGLTDALGPFGVAAGVAVVAVKALNDEYDREVKSATEAANRLKTSADLVASGATSADVQTQIDNLKTANAVISGPDSPLQQLVQLRDKLREKVPDNTAETAARIREAASKAAGGAGDTTFQAMKQVFQQASQISGTTVNDFQSLQVAINGLDSTSSDYGQKILDLNKLLLSGALAANDAAEAAKKLADAQVAGAQKALDIDGMTKAQRDAKAAQDERDIDVLTRIVGAGGLSTDALKQVAAQITGLSGEVTELNAVSESYADILEREKAAKQAATDANQGYFDELAKEISIRDAITKTEQDITDVRAEAVEKEQQLEADAAEKREQIEADAGDQRALVAQNSLDTIAKIERDAGRAEGDAVRNRNVDAFLTAKQHEKDALDDQQKADEKQLAAVEKSEAKQLVALHAGLIKQEEANVQSQNKQVSILSRARAQEEVDLTNVLSAERGLLAQSQQATLRSTYETYGELALVAYNGGKAMVQSFLNGLQSGYAGTSLPPVTGTGATSPLTQAVNNLFDARFKAIYEG